MSKSSKPRTVSETLSQKTLMVVDGLSCLAVLFSVILFVVIQLKSWRSSEPIATNDLDVAPSAQVKKSEVSQSRPRKAAVGGAVWAWIYERTKTLYAPWLSHLVVDAGIFLLGDEILKRSL